MSDDLQPRIERLTSVGGEHLRERLVALAGSMRRRGAPVGTGQVLLAQRALATIDASSIEISRSALCSVLCADREDEAAFDAAFAETFAAGEGEDFTTSPPRPWNAPPQGSGEERLLGGSELARGRAPGGATGLAGEVLGGDLPGAGPGPDGEAAGETEIAVWSPAELLRHRDFSEYDGEDEAAALVELRRLAAVLPERRSRRLRGASPRGTRPATRQMLRAAARRGGELPGLRWRQRSLRPRRLLLACDVSASMRPHSAMLLRYVHACVSGGGEVEGFVFGTRLTRVTPALRSTDPALALMRLEAIVDDAAAGTRIGAALSELNREWGRLSRGAVVVVLSDGWDRGEPGLLGEEVARLRRCAHRLIWLNPLSARAGYEPLVRGMSEALPHLDELRAGNTLAALELLASELDQRRDREGSPRQA